MYSPTASRFNIPGYKNIKKQTKTHTTPSEVSCSNSLSLIYINPLIPRISLVILLTACYTVLVISPLTNIFFILITCLLDIVLILLGEIMSWSLIGVKGLRKKVIETLVTSKDR